MVKTQKILEESIEFTKTQKLVGKWLDLKLLTFENLISKFEY